MTVCESNVPPQVSLRDSIEQGVLLDAGEARLSMSTLQVVAASLSMCTDESVMAITRAAREEVVRPGGEWIADADNIDAHYTSRWQQQQQQQSPGSLDANLTRCAHFMADLERPHNKKW
jgi:hypothetical protein